MSGLSSMLFKMMWNRRQNKNGYAQIKRANTHATKLVFCWKDSSLDGYGSAFLRLALQGLPACGQMVCFKHW